MVAYDCARHYIAGTVHLETGELLPLPSQRVLQTLFLASAIICSYMHLDVCSCLRLKRGACTLLCNFHMTPLPPPPPPPLVLYQRVQIIHILKCIPLTNSALFLLHLSFSSTRLERRGLDSPTIMAA